MKLNIDIFSESIILKSLNSENVSKNYLNWLINPNINQFLEIRHFPPQTLVQLFSYLDEINNDEETLLLGIFLRNGRHIGNIKIGPIDWIHKRGDIGLIIGEIDQWGCGHASKAIELLSHYAFNELKLEKLTAGCYEENFGSIKAFLRNNFIIEGKRDSQWIAKNGKRCGDVLLGLTASCYYISR